jgi:CheY-like chemotaxis protein
VAAERYRRVLVVDDDADTRDILTSVLQTRGIGVDTAHDGETALVLLRDNQYSVVLLDLLMPGTDGFRVLEALRAAGLPLPVVLVVTGAEPGQLARLDASIIHGIVRKPFDPQELAGIVQACDEIRGRSAFETMALAAMLASTPLISFFSR